MPNRYAKQTLRRLRNDIPIALFIADILDIPSKTDFHETFSGHNYTKVFRSFSQIFPTFLSNKCGIIMSVKSSKFQSIVSIFPRQAGPLYAYSPYFIIIVNGLCLTWTILGGIFMPL